MDNELFLLPLSKQEIASLMGTITIMISTIDTMVYVNDLQRQIMMAHKLNLESVHKKITVR